MRLNRSQIYDRIIGEFEEKGCKLLTTKEEFLSPENLQQQNLYKIKLKYKAQCNHQHNVIYSNFKYIKSGLKCPQCWSRYDGDIKKKNMQIMKYQEYTILKMKILLYKK